MTQPPSHVDAVSAELRNGQARTVDDLFPFVYQELRQMARRQIGRLNPGQTLTPTALVHEVYVRFADMSSPQVIDRHQFTAVAACAMRRVIIDYLRRKQASKRNGGPPLRIDTPERAITDAKLDVDVLALDKALSELEALDTRQAKIVEMRFFGGLSIDEIAEAMKLSDRTIKREWQRARTFLLHALRTEFHGQTK
jgi:RNA polymerase sigma factor (TIGR02999 family)